MNKHGRMGTKMSRCLFQVFALLCTLAASSAPASSLYFVHTDHLGTPQKITDGAQQVVWEGSPMPFGETEVVVNQIDFHVRFPGQYFDGEAGLHYNYFRDYEPGSGRYIQSDPIGLAGGINTYGYAYQNPITNFDPDGRAVWFAGVPAYYWLVGGVGIGGAYVVGQNMTQSTNSGSGVQYWDPATSSSGGTGSPQCPPNDPFCQDQNQQNYCKISNSQLERKWKHAKDFGVSGNYNSANAASYGQAIRNHVSNPHTRVIQGTYRGQAVTHFYNPQTGLNVISRNGDFLSGWRLSSGQVQNLIRRGSLGGG